MAWCWTLYGETCFPIARLQSITPHFLILPVVFLMSSSLLVQFLSTWAPIILAFSTTRFTEKHVQNGVEEFQPCKLQWAKWVPLVSLYADADLSLRYRMDRTTKDRQPSINVAAESERLSHLIKIFIQAHISALRTHHPPSQQPTWPIPWRKLRHCSSLPQQYKDIWRQAKENRIWWSTRK